MIVKVQMAISSTEPMPRVMVYNEHRDWMYEGLASDEIVKAMKGDLKAFFHAMPVKKGRKGTLKNQSGKPKMNYELAIGSRAPWQSW